MVKLNLEGFQDKVNTVVTSSPPPQFKLTSIEGKDGALRELVGPGNGDLDGAPAYLIDTVFTEQRDEPNWRGRNMHAHRKTLSNWGNSITSDLPRHTNLDGSLEQIGQVLAVPDEEGGGDIHGTIRMRVKFIILEEDLENPERSF